MQQLTNHGDSREAAACTYCRNDTETRDHVPARVLLDEPFPENLSVVPSCLACNNAASADEEYLACLVECVVCGTTKPAEIGRPKIRRLLGERPALQARLTAAHTRNAGASIFAVEQDRVAHIVVKLARGHSLYELNESVVDAPSYLDVIPLHLLNDRAEFERTNGNGFGVWPEVGSRAMQRLAEAGQQWIDVQPGRYRFIATAEAVVRVRLVLSEYLACEVVWDT